MNLKMDRVGEDIEEILGENCQFVGAMKLDGQARIWNVELENGDVRHRVGVSTKATLADYFIEVKDAFSELKSYISSSAFPHYLSDYVIF